MSVNASAVADDPAIDLKDYIRLTGLEGRGVINSPEAVRKRGGQQVKVHSMLQY